MECLGNSLLYLCHGELPWQGIYTPNHEFKMRRIGEMKEGAVFQALLRRSPPTFTAFFDHTRSLDFADKPNYELLVGLFENCMKDYGYEMDGQYDWIELTELGTLIPGEYKFDLDSCLPLYAYGDRWL
jgi:hypothetical protein